MHFTWTFNVPKLFFPFVLPYLVVFDELYNSILIFRHGTKFEFCLRMREPLSNHLNSIVEVFRLGGRTHVDFYYVTIGVASASNCMFNSYNYSISRTCTTFSDSDKGVCRNVHFAV